MYEVDFSILPKLMNKWIIDLRNDRNRYVCCKGGGGSGKSYGIVQLNVYRCITEVGHKYLVVRKVGKTIRESIFALIQEIISSYDCMPLFKVNKTDMTIECINGNKFIFTGIDDVEKLKSIQGITDIIIEEASELEITDYRQLNIRMRGRSKYDKQMFLMFNPIHIGHWLKVEFFDNRKVDATVLETTYKDNRFLDDAAVKVLEDFKDTDPYYYMVYCLGHWGIIGGNYFKEFREDIHVIAPFDVPKEWNRYRTIDYGLDMCAVLWIAIDTHNHAYVYKELYESNLIISDAAKKIIEFNGDDLISASYAPPDLFNRRQETGKSAVDIFRENGVGFMRSNNDRITGWYNVKEWLRPYNTLDEQTGKDKKVANLQMFCGCTNIIRTLPQLQQDKNDFNDVSNEPHELTHAPDALRGFCMTRSRATEIKKVVDPYVTTPQQRYNNMVNNITGGSSMPKGW